MTNGTTPVRSGEESDSRPLDVPTMRATTRRLLGENPEVPTAEEVETLTLTLRGMIEVAIPDVVALAHARPADDVPAICARIGVGEARARLGMEPRPGLPAGLNHARRLARSVNALADHYEALGGGAVVNTFQQVCRWCDELIKDPGDVVAVALKNGRVGPGYTVYAHRDHAHLVEPNRAHGEMRAWRTSSEQ